MTPRTGLLLPIAIVVFAAIAAPVPVVANTCEGLNGGPGDLDGDGFSPPDDCAGTDSGLWSPPGEVTNLQFTDKGHFVWNSAQDLGGTRPVVYNVYRAGSRQLSDAECFDPVVELTESTDLDTPASGAVFHYLAQAQNDCDGGSVGTASNGLPRPQLSCDCSVLCDDGDTCTTNTCTNGTCENPPIEPLILLDPQSGSACAGNVANFHVYAAGTGSLSYQWMKDGNPVGIDSPSLLLPSVTVGDNGAKILVVITDGCSSATSREATLSVFADSASCAGGLDGFEAPNGAGDSTRSRGLGGGTGSGMGTLTGSIGGGTGSGMGTLHLHSGEYVRREVDLVVPGRGFDFMWTRSYRSRELLPPDSVQGRQWMHGYDRRVDFDPFVPGNLLLIDGSTARVDSFEPSLVLPNCWVKPGFFQHICQQPDFKLVLTFADKEEWIFQPLGGNPAQGRIEAVVDRNNNAMFFNYDAGSGRLTTIVDTLGRPYELFYNPNGLVEAVADFTGRQCVYDYYEDGDVTGSAGDLKSVTTPTVVGTPHGNDFPDGKTTVYTYSSGFGDDRLNHNLLTITDPGGQTFLTNVYAPTDVDVDPRFDRLDRIQLPDDEISFVYVVVPPDPVLPQIVSTTVVNDRAGNVSHYEYDSLNRLVRTIDFTGRADPGLPSDASTNRPGAPLRVTDPSAFQTIYQYNNEFLPTFVLFPNGNQVQMVFDDLNPDPRFRGNLQQRTRNPGPLGGDQSSITETWAHGTSFGTRYDARVHLTGTRSVDDGVIRDFGWKQVDGPFKFASQAGGTATKDRTQMLSWYRPMSPGTGLGKTDVTNVEVVYTPPSTGGSSGHGNVRGLDGSGLIPAALLPSVCKTPTPGGPIPIPYPNIAMCGQGGNAHDPLNRPAYLNFTTGFTDGRGLSYSATYDPNGNLETIEAPLVITGTLGGAPQLIVEEYDYNAFGQLTQHTTAAGRIDTRTYYTNGPQAGYLKDHIVDEPNLALTTTYEYDAAGNVTRTTDPRGNDTQYVRNELNQVVRIVDSSPFLYETDFYYDENDLIVRVDVESRDEQGNPDPDPYLTTIYVYDGLDRLTRIDTEVEDNGICIVEEYEYDANSNPVERRKGEATNGNDLDNTVTRLYDERDLLFRETRGGNSSDASTTRFDYDGNSNVVRVHEGVEDPDGPQVWTQEYDGYDRLVQTGDPLGDTGSRSFDANDTIVYLEIAGEELQGAGLPPVVLYTAGFLRDEVNRIVVTSEEHFLAGTPPSSIGDGFNTTEWFYDPDSRLIRVTDDNGHSTSHQHDTARRVFVITDGKSNTETYTYDANSNVVRIDEEDISDLGSPPEPFETTYVYDALDRLTRTTDNDLNEWDAEYDSRDNVRVRTDSLDNETRQHYDGYDRLVRTERDVTDTGAGGGVVVDTIVEEYCWDDSLRRTCRIDDNGNMTEYAYDSLDRIVETRQADGTADCVIWEVQNNPVEEHDANGTVQLRVYDGLDRLVSNSVSPGAGVGGTTFEMFQYDGLSRRRSAEDDDSVVTFHYDSLSNVVEETLEVAGGLTRSVTATHDGVGNATSVTYPSGDSVATLYDELDRPTQIQSGGAIVVNYSYVGPYRVEREDRPLDSITEYTYDSRRNLTRTFSEDGVGIGLDDHVYAYDPMYNVTLRQDGIPGGRLQEWDFDSLYRIDQTTDTAVGAIDYDLDGPGNRLAVTGGPDAGLYTLDPTLPDPGDYQQNQYTTTPEGPRAYDANGNLTTRTTAGGLSGYVYDYDDRLTEYQDPVGNTHTYSYDPLGRRIQKVDTTTGDTTRFYYDGWHVVEEQDDTDTKTRVHIYGGSVDELLETQEGQDVDGNGGLDRFVFFGSAGHVTTVLDGIGGLVVERYDYDDYGRPRFFDSTGSAIPESAIRNPYLFTGRRYDEETGFYYDRSRYLDPDAGRYATRADSEFCSLGNCYGYMEDNPWSTAASGALKKGDKVALVGFESWHKRSPLPPSGGKVPGKGGWFHYSTDDVGPTGVVFGDPDDKPYGGPKPYTWP